MSYQPSATSNLQAVPAIPGETISVNASICKLSRHSQKPLYLPYHFKLPI